MLLETNRPPTDQERAEIRDSMAPTKAKLKNIDDKISDQIAHIEALKLQVEQANIKLDRLRDERGMVLETFADYRRVFSPYRNLPEDILREICIACVQFEVPKLSYRHTPMPYILSQTCGPIDQNLALTGMYHECLFTLHPRTPCLGMIRKAVLWMIVTRQP